MKRGKNLIMLALVLNLLVAVLLFSELFGYKNLDKAIGFQSLSGGLGLGASVNPRWGYINFDPRIERIEETNLYPVPGGYVYSPERGTSVSEFNEAW